MPLTVEVLVPEREAPMADLFEVTGMTIRPTEGTVTLSWRKRLRGSVGAVIDVASGSHVVSAAILGERRPDGEKTYHQNLKELAYGLLQEAGVFPDGGSLT